MSKHLVIAEHGNGQLRKATRAAVSYARTQGGGFDILLMGSGLGAVQEEAARLGADRVFVADHEELGNALADRHARVIEACVRAGGYASVVAATSSYARDLMPRVAALLDSAMVSDVVGVDAEGRFKRALYSGSIIATVELSSPVKFVTVRSTSFPLAEDAATVSEVKAFTIDMARFPQLSTYVRCETKANRRPDLTEARIVVSGGGAIKSAEDFERLVGGLADKLGASAGATRVLVDQGIASNTLQIGQTGKTVAPELYLALGVSGAIQHLAGMRDARIIAAINKDPNAPIFDVADIGLVEDVYVAVPELLGKLAK
ncbi:MAG: FAD-binding protein [Opitutaceae bacterium]|jgi:electron transfer flavoprotein alpha subunit